MSIFKCKMCGGTLEFEQGVTVGVCDSCGTKQTLPTADNEIITNLHNRANTLRLKCEFDKSEEIYNKILVNNPNDAEAHWGIILCKYGIEYVEDPRTYTRVPTCHKTSFEAIMSDADYKAAIENGDSAQRVIYEAEAKEIDRIQKDILAIVKNEKPFDVFICYKETDSDGKRTQDSVIASDIYYQLTEQGFKVFFAAITLEDKLGQEYEPYIFAALNSAKVMLVVGSKQEYFSAVWVRNEWSRFMKLMRNDRSKLLIPCYKDMDAYELPEDFAHLQALDMSKIGFINDLVRGIRKLIFAPEPQKVGNETVVNGGGAGITSLLKRVFMFLEDGEWDNAFNCCESILNQDPENSQAYLGKLLAELHVHKKEDLKNCAKPFDDKTSYKRAVLYGDTDLPQYVDYIKKRIEAAKDAEKKRPYRIANAILGHNYPASIERCKERMQRDIALLKRKLAEFPQTVQRQAAVKNNYDALETQVHALENTRSQLGAFKGDQKRMIDEQINEIIERRRKLGAELEILDNEIGTYKSVSNIENLISKRQTALEAVLSDASVYPNLTYTYEEAIGTLSKNRELKFDLLALYPEMRADLPDLPALGDYIQFGRYPQTKSGEDLTPIEWIILARENGKALVISKYALGYYRNGFGDSVTWAGSMLRDWLNTQFLNTAFSADEQACILTTKVKSRKGPTSNDKLFLLSRIEFNTYFDDFTLNERPSNFYELAHCFRKCAPTPFAEREGVEVEGGFNFLTRNRKIANGEVACLWWLRTLLRETENTWNMPAYKLKCCLYVDDDGDADVNNYTNSGYFFVRPAMWINLK